tara:strand:- start:8261 stop:10300 length:2040 start_codon:yes stop_codon:yes gene_type:complete
MPQNKAYKDRIVIVDADQVGPKDRTTNPDGFHPMVRDIWSTGALRGFKSVLKDEFRAVLGNYYTIYLSSKGSTLWNYSNPGDAVDHSTPGVGRLDTQVENIVLDLNYDASEVNPRIEIVVDNHTNQAWNNFLNRSDESTSYLEEMPNFAIFMGQVFGDIVGTFLDDHTSTLYLASENQEIREKSGLELKVEGKYQFYLSTSPPYEELISDASLPEHLLPNAYIMQAERLNTGSTAETDYNLTSISLDGNILWFNDNTATELNEGEYYQLYSEAAQNMIQQDTLSTTAQSLNYLSNVGILHSDLGITEEEHISTISVPFYNKITIGKDEDGVTGLNAANKVLKTLANDPETKDIIDYLQLRAINSLATDAVGSANRSFQVTTRTQNSATDAQDFAFNTRLRGYEVLFVATDHPSALPIGTQPEIASPDEMERLTEYNNDSMSPDFILLRDFARASFDLTPDHVDNARVELTTADGSVALRNFIKKYSQILAGTPCHTETLMYVIEKRRVIDNNPGEVVQKFFISNRFSEEEVPITIYDTQVKYGQRYIYDIKKVSVVFGNRYLYHAPLVDPIPADEDSPQGQKSLPQGEFDPGDIFTDLGERIQEEAEGLLADYETTFEPTAAEIEDQLNQMINFGASLPSASPSGPIGGPRPTSLAGAATYVQVDLGLEELATRFEGEK